MLGAEIIRPLGHLLLMVKTPLSGNIVYYLAVYNQINGSSIGGRTTGTGTVDDAIPINFKVQNLTRFAVGDQSY